MKLEEILKELENYGDKNTKRTLGKHGAKEPFFGVKVGDLKKILKKTKKNHDLSLQLFNTGNSDAMYLAGLMADEKQITKEQLEVWVNKAYWHYLSEYTVPWVAAETKYGFELGIKWIKSDKEAIAAAGWATLSNFASVKIDDELDIAAYQNLLDKVGTEIHKAPNRVRYTMNGFVIAVGAYIKELTQKAQEIATLIGKVQVEMGGTSCKVPLAKDYLERIIKRGTVGRKRKVARC